VVGIVRMQDAHRGKPCRPRPGSSIQPGYSEVGDEDRRPERLDAGQQPPDFFLDGFPVGEGLETGPPVCQSRQQGVVFRKAVAVRLKDKGQRQNLEAVRRDDIIPAAQPCVRPAGKARCIERTDNDALCGHECFPTSACQAIL
jgi:hypothetical protein